MANLQPQYANSHCHPWGSRLLLFLIIPFCNLWPAKPPPFAFALGAIQSSLYKVDSSGVAECFADYRAQAMQTIRSKSPKSALDSAVCSIYWGHFDRALEILDRCLTTSTNPDEQGFLYFNKVIALASKAANAGFLERTFESRICAKQALNVCDTVQQWCEREQLYWMLRAHLYRLIGDVNSEISGYRELFRMQPKDTQFLNTMAEYCYDLKQNEAADSTLQTLHSLGSMSVSEWALWAKTQFRLEQFDKCIVSCDSVLAGDRRRQSIMALKGRAYYQLDRYEEAVPIFSEVVRRDPTDDWSWFRLGYSLRRTEHCIEAIEAFRKALHIDPKWAACYRNMARCAESMEDLRNAVIYADSAVRLASNDVDNFWLLGWLLQESNRYEQSITAYRSALDLEHDNADIWFELSASYSGAERDVEMFAALDSVLKYDPLHVKALRALGAEHFRKGSHREALKCLRQLVELDVQDAEAWEKKSVSEYLLGYYDESLKSCNEALKLAPDRTDLISQKRDILLKLGRKE